MNNTLNRRPLRGLALLLPLLAAACTDSSPVAPVVEPAPQGLTTLRCTVEVQSGTMACANVDPTSGSGVKLNRIFGSQNRDVRLTSSGGFYDAGTQIFQTNVTVQNLTQQALGTTDGSTPTGIRVFFETEPMVTTSGTVDVRNPSGNDFFTAPSQDFFLYNEVLQPSEISSPLTWQFDVSSVGTRFSFVVKIQAAQPNGSIDFADKVWNGSVSTEWSNPSNWEDGVVPDSGSTVLIPTTTFDAVPLTRFPVLSGDVQVTNLNVVAGATLALSGFTLTAWGSVDALGPIAGGTVWMRGSGVVTGGNLPSVIVSGGTTVQRSTTTSGALSISDGSLVVDGTKPLSISIP
jgi:hypothetical protein